MVKTYASTVVIAMALWASGTPEAVAEEVPGAVRKAVGQSGEPARSSRLRFRSGPVCMCSTGLGEEEIQAAERKRLESIVEPQESK